MQTPKEAIDAPLPGVVGDSPAMRSVYRLTRMVASARASVLLIGETGTGKEVIARNVHRLSPRADGPYVRVNCGALSESLLESELFGHIKGAFTGAVDNKTGRFEAAHGGTIFLDEINSMSAKLQVKLLRVLQEHEFERVGGRDTIKADVRVIAATNRDIGAMAANGTFRSDLYYRLNVFPITVPPLRDRAEDVPLLVHYFASRYAAQIGKRITRVPAELMERLCSYAWPGNVRELEHVIERAVILSSGPDLDVSPDALALPATDVGRAPPSERPHAPTTTPSSSGPELDNQIRSLVTMEKEHILAALGKSGWRIEGESGAAALLNMNPSTLRSRMKKHGIRRNLADS